LLAQDQGKSSKKQDKKGIAVSQNESSFYKGFTLASIVIVATTVVFVAIFVYVQNFVNTDASKDAQDPFALKTIEERIKPTGSVQIAGHEPVAEVVVAAVAATPAENFTAICSACHATGVLGAPKIGDKAAWAPRIAQGIDTLKSHALSGIRMMPPRGGSQLDDAAIGAVVEYMAAQGK